MIRTPFRVVLSTIALFAIGALCAGGQPEPQADDSRLLRQFDAYMQSAKQRSLDDLGTQAFSHLRGRRGVRERAVLSPDDRYIVVDLPWLQKRPPEETRIEFYSVENGKLAGTIASVTNHGLTVYPETYLWEPDCKHVWVQMCYTDGGYGDWAQFGLDKMRFTEQGSEVIDYMLSIPTDPPPDWTHSKPRTWPSPPVWSDTGQRYDSYLEAEKAGVKRFWEFPDRTAYEAAFSLPGDLSGKVALDRDGKGKLEDGRPYTSGKVFVQEQHIATLKFATPHIPSGAWIVYEGEKAVVYCNLGARAPEERAPFKIHLGERAFCGAMAMANGNLMLVTERGNKVEWHMVDTGKAVAKLQRKE